MFRLSLNMHVHRAPDPNTVPETRQVASAVNMTGSMSPLSLSHHTIMSVQMYNVVGDHWALQACTILILYACCLKHMCSTLCTVDHGVGNSLISVSYTQMIVRSVLHPQQLGLHAHILSAEGRVQSVNFLCHSYIRVVIGSVLRYFAGKLYSR